MNNTEKARIIKVTRGQFEVLLNGEVLTAKLTGKLKYRNEYPVIGDYVLVRKVSENDVVIEEICERKSFLGRPDGSGHADRFVKNYVEQAMVANLDYLFIVSSMNDDFSMNRIIRFTATSVNGGCKPVIILTKADLCKERERFIREVHETAPNMEVYCVSSVTGEGMEELRKYLKKGVTIGMMGSSGVGKSTLVNALSGHESMKTGGIREKDSKGRHTTTHREMIDIDGTYFIDTPGMREFAIGDVEDALNETFDDIAELITRCRFSNCSHKSEPGCAVKEALENGSLPEERWEMYRSLMRESSRVKRMMPKEKTINKGIKR